MILNIKELDNISLDEQCALLQGLINYAHRDYAKINLMRYDVPCRTKILKDLNPSWGQYSKVKDNMSYREFLDKLKVTNANNTHNT